MENKSAWWTRRSFWLWVFGVSTLIWVVVGFWLFARLIWRPELPVDPAPPPASVSGLDAATLTAAGAFVTSVGSLVAIVLSHLKSQREMELEHQLREQELELERARLELERLKLEAQQRDDDD